jgi:hypothetical protein
MMMPANMRLELLLSVAGCKKDANQAMTVL